MKNLNLLRLAATFSLLILLFGSCSKDSLTKEQIAGRANGINQNRAQVSITLMLRQPYLMVSMAVFNDDYTADPVLSDENGLIEVYDLPDGYYTVQLTVIQNEPLPRDYHDIIFTNVRVTSGEVVDLGEIEFP